MQARMTGGGPNEAGEIEDEDILILTTLKKYLHSWRRVYQRCCLVHQLSQELASFDLFEPPTTLPPHKQKSVEPVLYHQFDRQEVIVNSRPEGSRKRKRGIEQPNRILSACDLLPLQQEVLCKQMEVLSAQLQLIEEQREYYRLKKQRHFEIDQF